MKDRDIEINIEKLSLVGFQEHQQQEIAESLKVELVRLLKTRGIPETIRSGVQLDRVQGNSIKISPVTKPGAIGYHAARAVYAGLGQKKM